MKVLKVPDMHCEMCVKRITDALTAAKLHFAVSLADKTVSVEETQEPAAVAALDELGFTAE